MNSKTKIREIFTSIQGEGPYIGYKQLFIRFCGCNLNCEYCDTDFLLEKAKEYSVEALLDICNKHLDCFSLSLTGGEPLLSWQFLSEFLPKCKLPIYLETNGTMYNELVKIIDYIDYIAADIKLPSCTGLKPQWENHARFFNIAKQKELFIKIVFDYSITDNEIQKSVDLCKECNSEIILQPKMIGNSPAVSSQSMTEILEKYIAKYPKTRLIPQVHKFLNID